MMWLLPAMQLRGCPAHFPTLISADSLAGAASGTMYVLKPHACQLQFGCVLVSML